MSNIGFVGLGNMGSPMAANLVRAGHDVKGFDLSPAARARAEQAGIKVSSSAADAVIGVDVVITMLPSAAQLLDLYGSQLVRSATPRTLFIDCSTTDVSGARSAHAIASEGGMLAIDAPVSGGVSGATNGTLTFMVGGDVEALRRAEPILAAMGKRIVHCGEAGTGQAAKICNNMILGVSMIAVSEAFLLGEALGISAQALFEVLSTSSGQCWSVTSYCPVPGLVPSSPANNGYAAGFATSLMLKDLNLARDAADTTGTVAALGRQAAEIYSAVESSGSGSADFSGVIQYIRSERKKNG